jgi:hypothetical protein
MTLANTSCAGGVEELWLCAAASALGQCGHLSVMTLARGPLWVSSAALIMQWCLPWVRQQAGSVDSVDTAKSGAAKVHTSIRTREMAGSRRIGIIVYRSVFGAKGIKRKREAETFCSLESSRLCRKFPDGAPVDTPPRIRAQVGAGVWHPSLQKSASNRRRKSGVIVSGPWNL